MAGSHLLRLSRPENALFVLTLEKLPILESSFIIDMCFKCAGDLSA